MNVDIMTYYARLHDSLKNAENQMENAIQGYSEASEVYAGAVGAYEERLGLLISQSSHPVTIKKDIARGECSDLKVIMEKADGMKKKCQMMVNLWEHRINDYKFTGRKIEDNLMSKKND